MRAAKTGEPDLHCVHKPIGISNVLDFRFFLSTLNFQLSTGLWVVERWEAVREPSGALGRVKVGGVGCYSTRQQPGRKAVATQASLPHSKGSAERCAIGPARAAYGVLPREKRAGETPALPEMLRLERLLVGPGSAHFAGRTTV